MKMSHILGGLALSLTVSACASVETASRANLAPLQTPTAAPQSQEQTQLSLASFNVVVPETLSVSEANRYYPGGDIVWRGDPLGNRHAQVQAIFESSLNNAVEATRDGYPVALDIQVLRFHALTEKARYTVGGVHAITFQMQIKDAKSGLLLAPARVVVADLEAFGGETALKAEAEGLTQKVRITGHLAEVIRQELSQTGGYKVEDLGFFQAVNKL